MQIYRVTICPQWHSHLRNRARLRTATFPWFSAGPRHHGSLACHPCVRLTPCYSNSHCLFQRFKQKSLLSAALLHPVSLPFSLGLAGEGGFQLSHAGALLHFVSLFLKDTFAMLNFDSCQTMPAHSVVCREKSLWLLSRCLSPLGFHSVCLGFTGFLGPLGLYLSSSQGNIQPLCLQSLVPPLWGLWYLFIRSLEVVTQLTDVLLP